MKTLSQSIHACSTVTILAASLLAIFPVRNCASQLNVSPLPKDARELTTGEVERSLLSDFKFTKRIEEFPDAVKSDFAQLTGEPFAMVNPGQEMSTDDILPGVPNKRLKFLGLGDKTEILVFEQGGYVDTTQAILVSHELGAAWTAQIEGHSINDLSGLQIAVQEGQFKTWKRKDDELASPASISLPLCELLKNRKAYVGEFVTFTAHITAGKHVTGLWDNGCPNLGADLRLQESSRRSDSLRELEAMLRKHGLTDRPVIATLTGKWLGEKYEEHQFIAQPRLIFEASSASDTHQSRTPERRNFVVPH